MAAVVFDTSILLYVINPDAKPPIDPETNQLLEHTKQRIDYLVRKLNKSKTQVVIPTPALSELLVHAGTTVNDYVDAGIASRRSLLRIVSPM